MCCGTNGHMIRGHGIQGKKGRAEAREGDRISLECCTSITEGALREMLLALSHPQMCSPFLRQPCSSLLAQFLRLGLWGRERGGGGVGVTARSTNTNMLKWKAVN